ncbi:hypothetical protein GGI03_007203, partial [Coemansia sp. RSA 2337]
DLPTIMSHFYINDLTKAGAMDVSDGKTTYSLTYSPHVLSACVCENCTKIKKRKADEAKKAAEEKLHKQGATFYSLLYGQK